MANSGGALFPFLFMGNSCGSRGTIGIALEVFLTGKA